MASQLRIYTIKQGQMDNWLRFFRDKVVPLHRKFGMPARIAWVNAEDSEFIWVRDFRDDEPIETQEQRYVNSEERKQQIGDTPKQYVEGMVVRVVELAHEER